MEANRQSRVSGAGSNIRFSDTPDASIVPPMLRRRLNFMGRGCISEMLQHISNDENLPIVFCSRHGDIERTLKVLIDLAKGEPASPMDFSLAVHNAIAGILSIHCNITANISSIATSEGAIVPVLLEAVGLLSESTPKVLCILCDVSLPTMYRTSAEEDEFPFVACFTVTAAGGAPLHLSYEGSAGNAAVNTPLDFLEFLAAGDADSAKAFTTLHNSACWVVRKSSSL
ncbi:MAG: beta-ketoacyl synthase chain length factor [Pseudomonadota bacterium]